MALRSRDWKEKAEREARKAERLADRAKLPLGTVGTGAARADQTKGFAESIREQGREARAPTISPPPDPAAPTREVSTGRSAGTGRARTLPIHCPTYMRWCRTKPCADGCGRPANTFQHFPPKGMGGATLDDTSGFGAHMECHLYKMQTYEGGREGPYGHEVQARWARESLARFFAEATPEEIRAALQEIARGPA